MITASGDLDGRVTLVPGRIANAMTGVVAELTSLIDDPKLPAGTA